jgi:hypothetical protein
LKAPAGVNFRLSEKSEKRCGAMKLCRAACRG